MKDVVSVILETIRVVEVLSIAAIEKISIFIK